MDDWTSTSIRTHGAKFLTGPSFGQGNARPVQPVAANWDMIQLLSRSAVAAVRRLAKRVRMRSSGARRVARVVSMSLRASRLEAQTDQGATEAQELGGAAGCCASAADV
eukprot:6172406-Pleurochrysis_carterae.AAC.2